MKTRISILFISLFSFCFASNNDKPSFSWVDESYVTTKVDFLYWQVKEGGMDFVYSNAITSGSFYGGQGDIHSATFDWHPGFRVSMNYAFPYDYWTINAQYGNIIPNGSNRITPLTGETIQGTFAQSTGTALSHALSSIFLRIHFADLYLSRIFQISDKLVLNFFNGLTGSWMKQNWEVTYEGSQPGGNRETVKPKWRFKGAGIKAGAEVDWQMGWGFNWTGKTSIAGMYGNYDNRMLLFTTNLSTEVRQVLQNTHYDDFRIIPLTQFSMGPSWQKTFRKWGMKIAAVYEMNIFFNVNQIDRDEFYNGGNSNPQTRTVNAQLQMHGLTAALLFSF